MKITNKELKHLSQGWIGEYLNKAKIKVTIKSSEDIHKLILILTSLEPCFKHKEKTLANNWGF